MPPSGFAAQLEFEPPSHLPNPPRGTPLHVLEAPHLDYTLAAQEAGGVPKTQCLQVRMAKTESDYKRMEERRFRTKLTRWLPPDEKEETFLPQSLLGSSPTLESPFPVERRSRPGPHGICSLGLKSGGRSLTGIGRNPLFPAPCSSGFAPERRGGPRVCVARSTG